MRSISRVEPLFQIGEGEPFSLKKRNRIATNSAMLEEDLFFQRIRFRSKPLLLESSVNNRCNLRCVMCRPEPSPMFSLPTEIVKDVLIGELFPGALVLLPSAGSEPFLGDLDLFREGCLTHEVQLNLITNGTLITKERLESLAPIIGRLQISLDGHRADLYESVRVGARFNPIVRKAKIAAEIAQAEGFELRLSAVFSVGLARELDAFVRFASGVGADSVAFQKIYHHTPKAVRLDAFQVLKENEITAAMNGAILAAERSGLDIHFEFDQPVSRMFNKRCFRKLFTNDLQSAISRRYPGVCFMAASYVKVEPDGNVRPCCVAGPSLNMGNLNTDSFESIWNGKAYQKFREAWFTGRYPEPCEDCKYRIEAVWQAKVLPPQRSFAQEKERSSSFRNFHFQTDPSVRIALKKKSFCKGETLIATAHVVNGRHPVCMEVKAWIELPTGEYISMIDPHFILHLQPNANFTREIFQCAFDGNEPSGNYKVGVRFLDPASGREFCVSVVSFSL